MATDTKSTKSKETMHRRFILGGTWVHRVVAMQYTQEGIVKITTMLLNMKQPVTVKNN